MKMTIGIVLAAALAVGAMPAARSLGTPSAPPDVSVNDWVPMGEAVGFVIEHGDSLINNPGVLRGYFAILRGGRWMRVDPSPEMAIRPAALAR
jgi:hypothetical protein